MKNILYLIILMNGLLYSQNDYVNQVLILNEGYLDFYTDEIIEPVTIGVCDISLDDPTYVDVIEIADAKFATDLIINGDFFYVAADNRVLKYHLDTYDFISSQNISGARKLAIYGEYLFVSKGDYDNETFGPVVFDSYLDVFDLNLNYQFGFNSDNGPQWSTENLLINDEKLYILINNAYEWGNYQGLIGIVNLNTMIYEEEIDLGDDGKNPINLMFENNKLYTLNNKNWDGSSVSVFDINSSELQTINLSDVSAGCGVSIIRDEKLNYQKNGESTMNILNLENLSPNGVEDNLNLNYYAIAENPNTGNMFAATSDFVTNSQVYVYDSNNNELFNFTSGVTTAKIVFDIRNLQNTTIAEVNQCSISKKLIKTIDYLGKEILENNLNNKINIKLYNDGSVEKQILIK